MPEGRTGRRRPSGSDRSRHNGSGGAALAAGCDVRRFPADSVRDADLADRAPDMLGVQQALRRAPDPLAVPVELKGGDAVDGLPAPFGANYW